MKKILSFVLTTFMLTGCAPLTLDRSTAKDVLFSKRDFTIDLSLKDKQLSISQVEQPVFNVSKDCRADADLASLIEDEGRVLASSDFGDEKSDIHVHQDVLEFESVELASEFLELVREGLEDPDCEYTGKLESVTSKVTYYDISTSKEFYSVDSDDSVVWFTDSVLKTKSSFSSLNLDLSSDSLTTVIRQNNYVLFLKGTIYRASKVDASMKDFEEDFAIIAKQFVTGKKVSN